MALSASFMDHAKELFAPFGEIRVRKMFGGAGVYCDDLFFAIMDDEAIYLKVDDATRPEFEARGLRPFTFETKDGLSTTMSYYNAPEDVFENDDELRKWTALALDAATRATKFKKISKKKALNPKAVKR